VILSTGPMEPFFSGSRHGGKGAKKSPACAGLFGQVYPDRVFAGCAASQRRPRPKTRHAGDCRRRSFVSGRNISATTTEAHRGDDDRVPSPNRCLPTVSSNLRERPVRPAGKPRRTKPVCPMLNRAHPDRQSRCSGSWGESGTSRLATAAIGPRRRAFTYNHQDGEAAGSHRIV